MFRGIVAVGKTKLHPTTKSRKAIAVRQLPFEKVGRVRGDHYKLSDNTTRLRSVQHNRQALLHI